MMTLTAHSQMLARYSSHKYSSPSTVLAMSMNKIQSMKGQNLNIKCPSKLKPAMG